MDDESVDIQTQASIDSIGAIAYAEAFGEGLVAMWTAMTGMKRLPRHLAEAAFLAKLGDLFGPPVEIPEDDEDDEDDDD